MLIRSSFEEGETSDSGMTSNENNEAISDTSEENTKTAISKITKVFKKLQANVNSFKTVTERVAFLKSRSDVWDAVKDEYEGSILHKLTAKRTYCG